MSSSTMDKILALLSSHMISNRFRNDRKPLIKLKAIQVEAIQDIEAKILNGHYTFENCPCPICKVSDTEVLSEKDRYGLEFMVVMCKTCGLIYTNPRMTQRSYTDFYNSEYRRLYGGTHTATANFFQKQYEQGRQIFDFIQSTFRDKDFIGLKVLEVGCGAGGILHYFKQQKCTVLGVDLGKEYIDYGRSHFGLNLQYGSLDNVTDFTPDVVIYSHVMEHILDLESELLTLKRIGHAETLFYIEVPGIKYIPKNYKMDALRYFQNAHTFHFTLTSLTNLFNTYGFKLIKGSDEVRSIFCQTHGGKHKITNEYPYIYHFLKKMEAKRYSYYFNPNLAKRFILKFFSKISAKK